MPSPSTLLPLALLPTTWVDPNIEQEGAFVPVSLPGNTAVKLPSMIMGMSESRYIILLHLAKEKNSQTRRLQSKAT